MNAHADIRDIATVVETNPASVLLDASLYDRLLAHMKAETSAFVPDLSTEAGRKEIKSLAYKVTRTKTAIDAAGKKLNEDARAKINVIDEQRRKVRDDLDALAASVRRPLTDWEEAEDARLQKIAAAFDELSALIQQPAPPGASAQAIADRIAEVEAETYDPAVFDDRLAEIDERRAKALDCLRTALATQEKVEADRRELEELRALKEQREREDAERQKAQRLADEQAEREKAEQERQAKADAEYKANVARAAEEARQAEIAKANAQQERIEREAAEKVAAAEAEARAVREKAEREDRERQEALERTRREEAARQADREHRGKVMAAAKEALMAQGAGEATAKKIVLAIVAGEIPNVSMRF